MINITIACIENDLPMLVHCLTGIRKNLLDEYDKIYIISPNNENIIKFCSEHNLIFVDEYELMGFGKDKISYTINGSNRNGWLYQQLLKYNVAKLIDTDNYLVIDADHVLLKPIRFIDNSGNYIFYLQTYNHIPYFKTMKNLLGNKIKFMLNGYSFITDKMMFNKQMLEKMKNDIQEITGMNYIDAIIKYCDRSTGSGFSEYETYGTYFINNIDNNHFITRLDNQYISFDKSIEKMSFDEIANKFNNYNTLTLHKYAK